MKKVFFFLSIMASISICHAQSKKARIDSIMNYYATQYNFNGVAFVASHGEILLSKGYGYSDFDKKIKLDENSILQMGSNTKQFTAEIILQLASKNKLALDDKLSKYFPDYPKGNKITLHNLLTHTSGIFNYTDDTSWHSWKNASMEKIMAIFKDSALAFEPGSKFEYSNSNYMLLGWIIEKVTHKSYYDVVRENILVPCGMTHSGFDFANLKDKNRATGYYDISDTPEVASIADSSVSFAAGALYSTTGDMYKWHKALLSHKLLAKEWQEKGYTPFKKRYGYGWFIDTVYGMRTIGHTGGIPGFVSYFLRIEEQDLCIVILENSMAEAPSENTMALKILAGMYDKDFKMPAASKEIKLSADVLKKYTGEYVLAPTFSITISVKDNSIYAQGTGQPPFEILAESETMFYTKAVDAKIEFVKDDKGNINKMILHQAGHDIPGLKK